MGLARPLCHLTLHSIAEALAGREEALRGADRGLVALGLHLGEGGPSAQHISFGCGEGV